MPVHVVPDAELDTALRALIRTGYHVSAVLYRSTDETWHIHTDDALETRPGGDAA